MSSPGSHQPVRRRRTLLRWKLRCLVGRHDWNYQQTFPSTCWRCGKKEWLP